MIYKICFSDHIEKVTSGEVKLIKPPDILIERDSIGDALLLAKTKLIDENSRITEISEFKNAILIS